MQHSPFHEFLQEVGELPPERFLKIKAHQVLQDVMNPLELYHVLGNRMADQAAKTACLLLNEPWRKELDSYHAQLTMERTMLHDVCQLHVALFAARSQAAQQMSRLEDTSLPSHGRSDTRPVKEQLKDWTPNNPQVLNFPVVTEWFEYFSWGPFLAEQLYLWMQTTIWPVEFEGPLHREVGVSWLELGISFSMYIQQALPILRSIDASVRLIMVQDHTDVAAYAVTYTDIATTMMKMWSQAESWLLPESRAVCSKGLNTSLYSLGFGQSTSGLSPRPRFWAQERVLDHLVPILKGRQSYDTPFLPNWCEQRRSPLRNHDWKFLADRLKVVRRSWKGRGTGNQCIG